MRTQAYRNCYCEGAQCCCTSVFVILYNKKPPINTYYHPIPIAALVSITYARLLHSLFASFITMNHGDGLIWLP